MDTNTIQMKSTTLNIQMPCSCLRMGWLLEHLEQKQQVIDYIILSVHKYLQCEQYVGVLRACLLPLFLYSTFFSLICFFLVTAPKILVQHEINNNKNYLK